jgi:thiamine biosynthesis lipoprotein
MKRRAQPWLGTLVEITIADTLDDDHLNSCFNDAYAAVAQVHRLMSFHDPESDVSRINAAAPGASIVVHPHTWEVLRTALSVAEKSAGLFDIGCAAQLVEWDYLPRHGFAVPICRSGQAALSIDAGNQIKKSAAVLIDLGGIAKGYAVDMALASLKKSGVRAACVNAGGDLRVFGDKAFPIGIRNPRFPGGIALQIALQEEALATSGSYFSSKEVNGRAVSALLDGRSGQAITGAASASVRAPTCMLADALTKVVLASDDAGHPALHQFCATAFII